jgi:hypothetical protein
MVRVFHKLDWKKQWQLNPVLLSTNLVGLKAKELLFLLHRSQHHLVVVQILLGENNAPSAIHEAVASRFL